MKVCVAGTGYVGLVTASCLADAGYAVAGVDNDAGKVRRLQAGECPIYEPGLDDLLRRGLESGRLSFTTSYQQGVAGVEVIFICVGTPPGPEGQPDLAALFASARSAVERLTRDAILVVKSTAPVGTNDQLAAQLRPVASHKVAFASNPEFLKEGSAVDDFLRPQRVVIGTRSRRAADVLRRLYGPFVRAGAPILETDPRSAEMSKYACNGMLACRISFMNELARLCTALGADIESVRKVVGSDARIGAGFLFPGPGYGGSCFPKDVNALLAMGSGAGMSLPLVSATDQTNRQQRDYVMTLVRTHFGGKLQGKRFAIWGLSFKPRTDDVRESPAIDMLRSLLSEGAQVSAFDPAAMKNAGAALGELAAEVRFAPDACGAAKGADALMLLTEWSEFRRPDPNGLARLMRGRVVFDGRNVLDRAALSGEGFTVYGIGRPVFHAKGHKPVAPPADYRGAAGRRCEEADQLAGVGA